MVNDSYLKGPPLRIRDDCLFRGSIFQNHSIIVSLISQGEELRIELKNRGINLFEKPEENVINSILSQKDLLPLLLGIHKALDQKITNILNS